MAIISAGVTMNVIFAVLLAAWAYGRGVRELACAISSVRAGGAAWQAGLRTGDEITAIAGRRDPLFKDLQHGVTLGDLARGVEFTIRRPGEGAERTVLLKPDTSLGAPTVGVFSPCSLRLPADLAAGLPGAAAAAQPPFAAGDTIRAVDGKPVASYAELIAALSQASDKPVELTVDRKRAGAADQETVSIRLPPQPGRTLGIVMGIGPVKAVQADSPAAAAGVKAGDRLVSIGGAPVGPLLQLDANLRRQAGTPVRLEVAAEGAEPRSVEITPREVTWIEEPRWPASPVSVPSLGIAVPVDTVVAAVEAGSPADAAGIKPGERIVRARFIEPGDAPAADDPGLELSASSPSWPYVMSVLQQVPPETKVQLVVEGMDGLKRDIELLTAEDRGQFVVDRGLVFEPVYRIVKAESAAAALARGGRRAVEDLSLVYRFLGKLTSSQISPRLLGGPIEIAKQAGRSAEEGFGRLLLFLTMLSANLAVVNFLPIPVLDGGHMVFLLYEWIRGKPPSEGVVAALSYLGLALILTLMMFVFGLDLGLIPRR